MSLHTYSPGEVDLYLALVHEVTGFSEDSLIKITKDQPYFTTHRGAAGGVERLLNPDKTYTLQVSLSQTSPSNGVLNGLATLDSVSRVGAFPIFAKDGSGDSIFFAPTCWIESPPDADYGRGVKERIWTIKCADMVFGLSGNETTTLSQIGQLGSLLGQFGGNLGVF